MTQVYTQLCLTLLQRYLESVDPHNPITVGKFSDLPSTYLAQFNKLSQLAFEQLQQQRIVFDSGSVPKDLVHFGFLDSLPGPALYGGGITYNFLHLTVQEFLAAYHITEHFSSINVINCTDIWSDTVLMFVSGLTGFQFFKDSVRHKFFSSPMSEEHLEVTNLLLHCLFEGQILFDYTEAYNMNTASFTCSMCQQLDRYALGYCIANCSSATSWKSAIVLSGNHIELQIQAFAKILLKNRTIQTLSLRGLDEVYVEQLKTLSKALHYNFTLKELIIGVAHCQACNTWFSLLFDSRVSIDYI